ncbi:PAS domain S-box protein [Dictyobacter kobayashii]|uniref:histidine kinase n=1 Tax=Dictyobacter kobayashii TaxID=2014872 RepID=A0A402AE35_9CHLR|nr:PAS domain S-box protein [Dictyobacter kobayashii]GCE17312.1 hypothetical protein KDK_11120 [Dictyobacter kobayashii]
MHEVPEWQGGSLSREDIINLTGANSQTNILEENVRLMHRAIDSARNGIIITDHQQPDDPIIYVNQAFLNLTGYSKDEIIGRNCRFLQGQDREQEARFQLKHAIQAGESLHVQIKNYRKDGTFFWNDLLISPITDEHGTVTHFFGNQLDITERKEAEDQLQHEKHQLEQRVHERTIQLQETNEYLTSIVETIREALVILDGTMHVLAANEAFYRTFQVQPAETEGKLLYDLGNRQWNIPALRELLERILPEHNPFEDFEVTHNFPSIGTRTMLLNARQIKHQENYQDYILLAIEDISARKTAETDSMRNQALTQAVLNSLSAHVAVLDKEGVIVEVNEAWKRFALEQSSSSEQNTFAGQNYLRVLEQSRGEQSEEAPQALRGIQQVMCGERPFFSLEYPCFTPQDNLWFLLQVTPLKGDGGGVVVAHVDITERKRVELRKDDFISMAAHELKTPLTSMKLFVQGLSKRFEKEGQRDVTVPLQRVDAQIEKLTRLVKELLDVSRIYAGKLLIEQQPFVIAELEAEVVNTFRMITPDRTITFQGDTSAVVVGDRDRVSQVLTNLLTNAVKYSPDGSPIMVAVKEQADHVTISVQDFGIGIEPRYHARLFDRFYQVTEPNVQTYPGLGVGLYICQQIITQLGGKIWVESVQGEGSTFSFSLPTSHKDK